MGDYVCENCGKEFDNKNAIGGHSTYCNTDDLECEYCGETFKGHGGLANHEEACKEKIDN